MFCRLTPLQCNLYKMFVQSAATKSLLSGSDRKGKQTASSLAAITHLKKLCNRTSLSQSLINSWCLSLSLRSVADPREGRMREEGSYTHTEREQIQEYNCKRVQTLHAVRDLYYCYELDSSHSNCNHYTALSIMSRHKNKPKL